MCVSLDPPENEDIDVTVTTSVETARGQQLRKEYDTHLDLCATFCLRHHAYSSRVHEI